MLLLPQRAFICSIDSSFTIYTYVYAFATALLFTLTMLNVRDSSVLNGLNEKTHNRKTN